MGKKQRNVDPDNNAEGYGDVSTFVASDPESKLIPTFHVGQRDWEDTNTFIHDLSSRVENRIQLSRDGMNQFLAPLMMLLAGIRSK